MEEGKFTFNHEIHSIAVIGAGASGIVMAKAAFRQGFQEVQVFERRGDVGGVWIYNKEVGKVPSIPSESPFTVEPPLPGTPPTYVSPAYTTLWTNTPRDIMTYSDQTFPEGTPAFPFRTQVHEYLRTYADEIWRLIRFRTEIVCVEKRRGKWVLHITDLNGPQRKVSTQEFDAVAVATGHYDLPLIPSFPGLNEFPSERITHAKYYRNPSDFKSKRVLLIGNNASGTDIGNQLINHAKAVFCTAKSPRLSLLHSDPRIQDVASIQRFTSTGVVLEDGTKLDVDNIIFCTGYLYSFPLLPKELGFLTEQTAYIHHLYDQTFYVDDPSLAFIGMLRQILPFPTFQNQAIWITKVWANKFHLPSVNRMRLYETRRLEKYKGKDYHFFKFPEDVEIAERWRGYIENDKSEGWEKCMKPWVWTKERVDYRSGVIEVRKQFQEELAHRKWDHLFVR